MLIVDDQIFNIEFLRAQLEAIPMVAERCDYADNGMRALELVVESLRLHKEGHKGHNYGLVLMDYAMPFMNGVETTKEILKLY